MHRFEYPPYTGEEVHDVLTSSGRTIAFRYELLTSANVFKKNLTTVLSASIANSGNAEIRRTAKFRMAEDTSVNWLSDRIRPWFRVKMPNGTWAEWSLGIFLLSTPTLKIGLATKEREIDAYDQLLILRDDAVTSRYSVAAGANVITAVSTLLTGAGILTTNLVSTAETLPVVKEWKPGTSKLKIIQELLASINYEPLYFDGQGVAIAKPYQLPSERPTEYTYTADEASLLAGEMDTTLDLFNVPNSWLAIVSEPDRAPLTSIYTNSNPNSPTSTVSRGRTILKLLESQEATSQAVLDAKVAKAAYESSEVYETLSIRTALMPHHEDQDIIAVEYDRLSGLTLRYVEHEWSMSLTPGSLMEHKLKRVVSV
jgi:hypothetical protein